MTKLLGHGAYGTVYQAYLKADPNKTPLAMKVQNKMALFRKNQLKYAVGEANIMKQNKHPFIV